VARSKKPRALRKDRHGWSPFRVGVVLLAFCAVLVYFGFSKQIPFTHDFRLKAVFESANSIRPGSPVRIAGVNVGIVKTLEGQGDQQAAIVTMEIQDKGLPIHKDATIKIRPRIFLEGNFFADLKPGTPSSPILEDGDTIPITQTAAPVQLDELLTALQSDTRADLQYTLQGFGTALLYQPTAADDVGQDPDVQGKTGADALNGALNYSADAFKNGALVNQALLGLQPDDLATLVDSFGKVAGALARNETALADLVTNFNTTVAALADESSSLQSTIRQLGPTLQTTDGALDALNASFPATRAFAIEILPGVKQTAATIDASFPWISQTTALLSKSELGAYAAQLQPIGEALAQTTAGQIQTLPQINDLSRCFARVILPNGDVVIDDGALSTGVENFKEFFYALVGLAGEGGSFDGNGQLVRLNIGGGSQTVKTGNSNYAGGPLIGNAVVPPLGTSPKLATTLPPLNPNAPCYKQARPDLNGPLAGPGPPDTSFPSTDPPIGSITTTSATATTAAAGAQRSALRAPDKPSVAEELVGRLNPFASAQANPAAGGDGG